MIRGRAVVSISPVSVQPAACRRKACGVSNSQNMRTPLLLLLLPVQQRHFSTFEPLTFPRQVGYREHPKNMPTANKCSLSNSKELHERLECEETAVISMQRTKDAAVSHTRNSANQTLCRLWLVSWLDTVHTTHCYCRCCNCCYDCSC